MDSESIVIDSKGEKTITRLDRDDKAHMNTSRAPPSRGGTGRSTEAPHHRSAKEGKQEKQEKKSDKDSSETRRETKSVSDQKQAKNSVRPGDINAFLSIIGSRDPSETVEVGPGSQDQRKQKKGSHVKFSDPNEEVLAAIMEPIDTLSNDSARHENDIIEIKKSFNALSVWCQKEFQITRNAAAEQENKIGQVIGQLQAAIQKITQLSAQVSVLSTQVTTLSTQQAAALTQQAAAPLQIVRGQPEANPGQPVAKQSPPPLPQSSGNIIQPPSLFSTPPEKVQNTGLSVVPPEKAQNAGLPAARVSVPVAQPSAPPLAAVQQSPPPQSVVSSHAPVLTALQSSPVPTALQSSPGSSNLQAAVHAQIGSQLPIPVSTPPVPDPNASASVSPAAGRRVQVSTSRSPFLSNQPRSILKDTTSSLHRDPVQDLGHGAPTPASAPIPPDTAHPTAVSSPPTAVSSSPTAPASPAPTVPSPPAPQHTALPVSSAPPPMLPVSTASPRQSRAPPQQAPTSPVQPAPPQQQAPTPSSPQQAPTSPVQPAPVPQPVPQSAPQPPAPKYSSTLPVIVGSHSSDSVAVTNVFTAYLNKTPCGTLTKGNELNVNIKIHNKGDIRLCPADWWPIPLPAQISLKSGGKDFLAQFHLREGYYFLNIPDMPEYEHEVTFNIPK